MSDQEDQSANGLKAGLGVLNMTIHITRKATGNVETYDLVGTLVDEPNPVAVEGDQPEGA